MRCWNFEILQNAHKCKLPPISTIFWILNRPFRNLYLARIGVNNSFQQDFWCVLFSFRYSFDHWSRRKKCKKKKNRNAWFFNALQRLSEPVFKDSPSSNIFVILHGRWEVLCKKNSVKGDLSRFSRIIRVNWRFSQMIKRGGNTCFLMLYNFCFDIFLVSALIGKKLPKSQTLHFLVSPKRGQNIYGFRAPSTMVFSIFAPQYLLLLKFGCNWILI